MSIESGFKGLPRLVQIILLLIPGVNWLTEVLVRWSVVFNHKGNVINLVIAILVTIGFGFILGWIDLIWCLVFKRLIFT